MSVDCVDRCMGMDRWMFGSGDAMDYCCAGNADPSCKGLWEIIDSFISCERYQVCVSMSITCERKNEFFGTNYLWILLDVLHPL